MHRSLILTAAIAACALPSTAVASTVSTGPLTFNGVGAASSLTLSNSGSNIGFTDALQTLTAGTGCTAGTPVLCPANDLTVQFGTAADTFNGFSFYKIDLTAGDGVDTINASGSRTQVWGGNDGDTITVGSNGMARAWGEAGDDHLLGDNTSNTELFGGDDVDLVVGNSLNDLLEGGNGDDQLFSGKSFAGTANGGPGDDVIVTLANQLLGGTFTSNGGTGNDVIKGDRYVDRANGGDDADIIDVSGDPTKVDVVTCGAGIDTVYADPADSVAVDCENVAAGPMPYNLPYDQAVNHLIATFPQIPAP
jgi:Ca2+-binding RTX toxin-like protein